MKINYKITKVKNGVSQYKDEVFNNEHNFTNAIYIEHSNPLLKGNILASALPPCQSFEQIITANKRNIYGYNYSDEIKKPKDQQIQNLLSLQYYRIPLPFQIELARTINDAFMDAAINRYIEFIPEQNVILHQNGSEEISHLKSYGILGGTNGNAIITGTSGTGKSSSIITALKYYPQVIYHHSDEIPYFIQVSYIYVECPPNGNLSGLYDGIAKAYDIALKNLDNYHEYNCSKKNNLEYKEQYVRNLIDKYHTLLFVIDEVQNMNFQRNKPGSFYTLLKLKNETKISMLFSGLYEAVDSILTDLAMKRRAKNEINTNSYTINRTYFKSIIRELFNNYQWFTPKVYFDELPEEEANDIVDTMYKYTKGIIDQIMSLYKMMSYEFIIRTNKPKIDGKFIIEVNNKYFPGMLNLLNGVEFDLKLQEKRKEQVNDALDKIIHHEQSIKEKEIIKSINKSLDEDHRNELNNMSNQVISRVKGIFADADTNTIMDLFYRINKESPNMDVVFYAQKIVELFINQNNLETKKYKNKSKNKKRKVSSDKLDDYLDNSFQPLASEGVNKQCQN